MYCTIQKLVAVSLIALVCVPAIATPTNSTTAREWTVEGKGTVHARLVDLELIQVDGKKTVMVNLRALTKSDNDDKDLLGGKRYFENFNTPLQIPLQQLSQDDQEQALQEYAVILNAQRYFAKPRNWIERNGEKVHAKFIDLEFRQIDKKKSEVVVLERSSDANILAVPLTQLSAADQKNALRQAEQKQSLDTRFAQKQKDASEIKNVAAQLKKEYAVEQARKQEERSRLKKQYEVALRERGKPDVRGVFWGDSPEMVALVQEDKRVVLEKREVTVEDQKKFLNSLKSSLAKKYSAEIIQVIQWQNPSDKKNNRSDKERPQDKPQRPMSEDEVWQRVREFVGEKLKKDVESHLNQYIKSQLIRSRQKDYNRKKFNDDARLHAEKPLNGKSKSARGKSGRSKSSKKGQKLNKEIARLRSEINQFVSEEFGWLLNDLQLKRRVRLHGDIILFDARLSVAFFFDIGELSRVEMHSTTLSSEGGTRLRGVLSEKYGEGFAKTGLELNQLEQKFLGGDPDWPTYEPDSFFSEWRLPRTIIELSTGPLFDLTYKPAGSPAFLSEFIARINDVKKTQQDSDKTKYRDEL